MALGHSARRDGCRLLHGGVDDEDGSASVGGLLVDLPQHRTGIARAAIRTLIDRFVDQPGCPGMALSHAPDNEAARTLYRSLGFVGTGETADEAEVVARLPFVGVGS